MSNETYLVGTSVTIQVTFENSDGDVADVTTLKYRPYLGKKNPIAAETVLTPASYKISTGIYEFDYTIPADIDTDLYDELTIRIIGTVGSQTKVAAPVLALRFA